LISEDGNPSPWSERYLSLTTPPKAFTRGLPSISEECTIGHNYYFEGDGLRRVRPYYMFLDTVVKKKYAGLSLLDILGCMFPFQSHGWLAFKARRGLLQV